MSINLEDPQLALPPARRRKWGRVAAAVVVVLALAAGAVAMTWVARYQPLERCCGFGVGPGAKVIETIGLGTEYQFRASPRGTFELYVQLRNMGRLSVTIRDVVRDSHYYWRLRDVSLGSYGAEPYGNMGREYVAFKPVTMDPGDFLVLRLRYEFADCQMEDSWSSLSSFRVLYTAAWLKKEAELRLPGSIALRGVGGDCGDKAFR